MSYLYGCTAVSQSIDSTHSELVAVFDLLSQALLNHLDKITIVIDNQAAMSIATSALTTTTYDSIDLQRHIQKNPKSETVINSLYTLTKHFKFVAFVWQKAHISNEIFNVFNHLNFHADSLCTSKLAEVLNTLQNNAN